MNRSKSLAINGDNKKVSLLPEWLSPYTKAFLRYDLIAGAITAAVVIPKAMAYATVAGLPVQIGLYTVLFPMMIYAFFGSSRPLSVSTTTTLAILTASALGKAAPGSPAVMSALATLTLLVGIILLLASLGLLILRPEGRVFFVNASRFGEKIRSLMTRFNPRVVILDFSAVPDIEYTALKMLVEAEKKLKNEGTSLWLVGLNPEVLNVINRSGLGKTLGRAQLHFNMELAVKKYQENTNS